MGGHIELDTRLRRCSDLPWRRIEDEIFIITPDDGGLHSLNEVGSRIWELLDPDRDVAALVAALGEEYDVERERLEEDVLGLLTKLLKGGLVEVC